MSNEKTKESSSRKAPIARPFNELKNERHRFAWLRLKNAIVTENWLEAIAIEESLMSAVLIKFLLRRETEYENTRRIEQKSFSYLIERAKVYSQIQSVTMRTHFYCFIGTRDEHVSRTIEFDDLLLELNHWRIQRNECIHGIGKWDYGQRPDTVEDYWRKCHGTAIRGEYLTKCLTKWLEMEAKLRRSQSKSAEENTERS